MESGLSSPLRLTKKSDCPLTPILKYLKTFFEKVFKAFKNLSEMGLCKGAFAKKISALSRFIIIQNHDRSQEKYIINRYLLIYFNLISAKN